MLKYLNQKGMQVSAIAMVALISGAEDASAQNDFTTISNNIGESISGLPGMISGVSYMLGILLGVLGILKIKDHVENPSQTPLQHGAIRLVAGGGLLALPIVFEAMRTTVGESSGVTPPSLNAVSFGVLGGTTPAP